VPVPYDKVVIREVPMPFEVERVVEKIVEREVPVYVEQVQFLYSFVCMYINVCLCENTYIYRYIYIDTYT